MKIWVAEHEDGKKTAHWIKKNAEALSIREPYEIDLEPLRELVEPYAEFRHYKKTNLTDATLFLTSELGEFSDEVVQMAGGWIRNNPENKGKGVAPEGGDILMMLVRAMNNLDADPIEAMFEKFKLKGFDKDA
ncbi:MAG: hypothetical protein LWX83_13235 [Anaerolineae bacterium]|nr:hypothetical protein [Anaerolineae bacterium]